MVAIRRIDACWIILRRTQELSHKPSVGIRGKNRISDQCTTPKPSSLLVFAIPLYSLVRTELLSSLVDCHRRVFWNALIWLDQQVCSRKLCLFRGPGRVARIDLILSIHTSAGIRFPGRVNKVAFCGQVKRPLSSERI